ncbi:MAG: class I SAM-dependent methyltransferase [Candidatus Staskawiczbacteria bacterium]|jgi:ubiquinone/menaquinone biosynthesis C-methylase UbiE
MDKESVKKFYETFDFEKMIDNKAPELIQEFLDGEIDFISAHIKPNSLILEIGCGYGRLLKIMAEKSKRVIGIDFSNRMVELSKENLGAKNNVNIQLMEADKLTFSDDSFDYVVCLDNSFGNMPEIELDVLKEMKRVCKKDGEIVISVFSENAESIQRENYKRIGLTTIQDDGTAIYTAEGFYSRRFTKEAIKSLFNNVGLEPEIMKVCPINYIAYAPKTL